MVDGAKYLTFR